MEGSLEKEKEVEQFKREVAELNEKIKGRGHCALFARVRKRRGRRSRSHSNDGIVTSLV